MRLRPRQKTFVERSVAALASRGNTLGVAPTGAGKTIMLSAVTGEMIGDGAKACVLAHRDELVSRLIAHGWSAETRAAIVCGASTADEWAWSGRLADLESVVPPGGIAGVVVVGEVVQVRDALVQVRPKPDATYDVASDEVKYGRS